jgi:hypothetical protein
MFQSRVSTADVWANGIDLQITFGDSVMTSCSQHTPALRNRGSGSYLALSESDTSVLQRAILSTVAYSDIFDYPLTSVEVHRYLFGIEAGYPEVESVLQNGALVPQRLVEREGYFALAGREHIVDIRRQREERARDLWRRASRYGNLIARIPFVRMVAVTGELAVNNVRDTSDVDYFIVTEPGRLWLVRAMVIAIVKAAGRTGITICPNYLITENALEVSQQNLYTAREMISDPHYIARGMIERVISQQGWDVRVSGVLPQFARTPGSIRSAGPALGAHTREVLADVAQLGPEQIDELDELGLLG